MFCTDRDVAYNANCSVLRTSLNLNSLLILLEYRKVAACDITACSTSGSGSEASTPKSPNGGSSGRCCSERNVHRGRNSYKGDPWNTGEETWKTTEKSQFGKNGPPRSARGRTAIHGSRRAASNRCKRHSTERQNWYENY